jgi:hypothetical protein
MAAAQSNGTVLQPVNGRIMLPQRSLNCLKLLGARTFQSYRDARMPLRGCSRGALTASAAYAEDYIAIGTSLGV